MPATTLRPVGLRLWLFGLSLAALLPTLLFAVFVVLEYDHAAHSALLDDLVHRARALQQSTAQMIQVSAAGVRTLADSDRAQAGDWPGVYEQARRSLSHEPYMRAVTLVDRTGSVIFHTGMPFGAPLFPAHDLPSAEAAMRTGRTTVSGAFVAPISPKSVVAVSVPLAREGEAGHVLRAIIRTESIDGLLAASALPPGWIAGVTDARGTLLARSAMAEAYVGKPTAPSFLEAMRRGDGLPFKGRSLEGIDITAVVLPVLDGDWYLGVAVPDAILGAPLEASIRRILAFAALWLGLAFVTSYVLGSYIIRQARALVDAVAARPSAAPAGRLPRIQEFLALLGGVEAARQRETAATGQMIVAQAQRDEVFDLYEHAPCGYHSLDGQGRVLRMNETELRWLGRRWDEVRGRPMTDFLDEPSRAVFAENFPRFVQTGRLDDLELTLLRHDGTSFPASISASAVKDADGRLVSTRSTVFDITQRKGLEARLEQLARSDALTGLSNRRDFFEQAEREWQRHQRREAPLALLMLDIDHFKRINDRHGHDGGDRVLRDVAAACRTSLRSIDLVGRLGGEEFAVMLPETPLEQAAEVAQRLREAVAGLRVMLSSGQAAEVTVSIGVALCGDADGGVTSGLKRADSALYEAKAAGRDRVVVAGQTPDRTVAPPASLLS